ncbi:MAG: ferrous iron transport protein A [Holosporaceae bacterium]|jgi:Fe2+ transport system protein FeoA|nr:ferrous iron transport protein A [Holosporaceae bacterium]
MSSFNNKKETLKNRNAVTGRKLYDMKVGESARILAFSDEEAESSSYRMGIFAGRKVACIYKNGPIVITAGRQTTALDRNIAVRIYVE